MLLIRDIFSHSHWVTSFYDISIKNFHDLLSSPFDLKVAEKVQIDKLNYASQFFENTTFMQISFKSSFKPSRQTKDNTEKSYGIFDFISSF